MPGRNRLPSRFQGGYLVASAPYPQRIFSGQIFQRLPSWPKTIVGQSGEGSHGELDWVSVHVLDVRGHTWQLDRRHNIREQHCWPLSWFRVPASRTSVPNTPSSSFAVKKRQRLLFRLELLKGPLALWILLNASSLVDDFKIHLADNNGTRLCRSCDLG